jgi:putative SOS response-associated peptidase YedK
MAGDAAFAILPGETPMCGRYSLTTPAEALVALFDAGPLEGFAPRYNIAPTQLVPAVRMNEGGGRGWAWLRWGLIPSWAKDPAIGNRMINARAETVADKPAFRAALRRRRCLLPADGFYEWQKRDGAKQPYHIALAERAPFAFAGLWERWQGGDGDAVESCTVLTTAANRRLAPIHPRMPVILAPEHYDIWLDTGAGDPGLVVPLLAPYDEDALAARAVARRVNDPRNDDPGCLEP